jgi:uncharacterized DUF497 family protein
MAVQSYIPGPAKSVMDPGIAGFDWDQGNREKCQKHGVLVAAVEAMFHHPIAVFPAHSRGEHRFKAIGRSDEGRHILIVFTLRTHRGETFIRPISARYMHKREIDYYEEEAARAQKRR